MRLIMQLISREPHKSSKNPIPPPPEFFEYFFITLALTYIGRALISHRSCNHQGQCNQCMYAKQ